jgi:hypothetical protein
MKKLIKRAMARAVTSGSPRKRFLSYEELTAAVTEFSVLAKARGVRLAVLGGFALQLYGSSRLTTDLDFVGSKDLTLRSSDKATKLKPLSFGGQRFAAANGAPVDIIVRSDHYRALYKDALAHATRMQDVPVPVVRLEHLAAMKFASGRPKDELDLAFILTETNVDVPVVKKLIHKHLGVYAVSEFEQLVRETEWRHREGLL